MHPVIRLINLLVIAALAPWLPPFALAAAASLLLLVSIREPARVAAMFASLRRIRWLLVSLALLFAWFTPGEPLVTAAGEWSPTGTGIQLAIERALVLVVMVWAATFMLYSLEPRDLSAALRFVLDRILPLPVLHRFANRIGLVFAELPKVQVRVAESAKQRERTLLDRAADLVTAIEHQADESFTAPPPRELGAVPPQQWIIPLLVLGAGVMAAWTA